MNNKDEISLIRPIHVWHHLVWIVTTHFQAILQTDRTNPIMVQFQIYIKQFKTEYTIQLTTFRVANMGMGSLQG